MQHRLKPSAWILAFALVASATPSIAPAQAASSVVTGQQVPLVPLLTALALQAHIRIWVLPGTPNTAQTGSISAPSALENLERIVKLNGLVYKEFEGTLLIGTPLAIDGVVPPEGPVGSSTTKLVRAQVPIVGVAPADLLARILPNLPVGTIAIPTNRNSIYVIGSQRAVDYVRAAADPLAIAAVPITIYHPNYITAQVALTQINAQMPPTPPESIVADGASNTLSIGGPPGYQSQIASLMQLVDVPVKGVDYDIIIAEADPNLVNINTGVTLGQAQTNYSAVGTSAVGQVAPPLPWLGILGFPLSMGINLSAQVSLLQQKGHAHVLRRAKCFVVNGQTCSTGYNETIPYPSSTGGFYGGTTYASTNVGFTISLTPQISNMTTTSAANISYSTIAGNGAGNIPQIATRPTTTTVNTPNGQSFVITGLYDETETYSKTGVPLLSAIPLIGGLFSNVQKQQNQQELVIIITPNVTTDNAPGYSAAQFPQVPALLNSLPGGAPTPQPDQPAAQPPSQQSIINPPAGTHPGSTPAPIGVIVPIPAVVSSPAPTH